MRLKPSTHTIKTILFPFLLHSATIIGTSNLTEDKMQLITRNPAILTQVCAELQKLIDGILEITGDEKDKDVIKLRGYKVELTDFIENASQWEITLFGNPTHKTKALEVNKLLIEHLNSYLKNPQSTSGISSIGLFISTCHSIRDLQTPGKMIEKYHEAQEYQKNLKNTLMKFIQPNDKE